jgi:hypothetical protein
MGSGQRQQGEGYTEGSEAVVDECNRIRLTLCLWSSCYAKMCRMTSDSTSQFAYAATMLLSMVQQLCSSSSRGGACSTAVEWLTA